MGSAHITVLLCVVAVGCGDWQGESPPPKSDVVEQESKSPEPARSGDGADIAELTERLRSGDPEGAELAADRLAQEGPRALPALDELVRLLEDPSDHVCIAAVRAICAIGTEAASAIPALVKNSRKRLAESPDEGACWAVPYNCTFGPETVPFLVAELGSDEETDEIPENILSRLGTKALPALQEILAEGGYRAKSAARVLWRMGPVAKPAVPALVQAVRHGKISDLTFANTLGAIGAETPDALSELERIANNSDSFRTRNLAKAALEKSR